MAGSSLKKDKLSTPHRPSTCAAIFFICWRRLAFARWIVKGSLPEVNQFTGICFRVVRIVLKITFLGLSYPGQRPECPSLSYYGSWFRWMLIESFTPNSPHRMQSTTSTCSYICKLIICYFLRFLLTVKKPLISKFKFSFRAAFSLK